MKWLNAELEASDYFKMYVAAFVEATETKNLLKTKAYVAKSSEEKESIYMDKFYRYAHEIEREKLLYFSLVYKQTTVIITAPNDNAKQKEFLGYDWSNRKGNEGIQIITPGGKLYDDSDRKASGTLASAIRESYDELVPKFSEEQKAFGAVINTKDMLDFSRVNFNKSLRISAEKRIILKSKYTLKPIAELNTLLKRGKSPTYGDSSIQIIKSGQARGLREFDFTDKYYIDSSVKLDERKLEKGDLLINSTGKGTAGRVTMFNLDGDFVCDSHITIFRVNSEILSEYALYVLAVGIGAQALENMADGSSGQIELALETIKAIKIPVPPIPVQQQIIDECTAIDEEYHTTRMSIETYRQKIADLFNELDVISTEGIQTEPR